MATLNYYYMTNDAHYLYGPCISTAASEMAKINVLVSLSCFALKLIYGNRRLGEEITSYEHELK